jgi:ATP-dependent Clp protease ATP-binding subunit ClpB
VFNVLLQVLDDGRLTDGKGRTVDFKNVIVIMTSNLGSEHFPKGGALGFGNGHHEKRNATHDLVMQEVRHAFRPEFLNRIDDIVIFEPLAGEAIERFVDLQVARLEALVAERRIHLRLTAAARKRLAEVGVDPVYGARPLKRALQREVQNPLALRLLEGEFPPGTIVEVDVDPAGEGMRFRAAGAAPEAAADAMVR